MRKSLKIVLVVALIIIVPTGIWLGLAYPSAVLSQPVNASGLGVASSTFELVVGFPKTQMQVVVEVTDIVALGAGVTILNATGHLVESLAFSTTGTFATIWFNAAGGYNITVYASTIGIATIVGQLTVYARGPPFAA
ncbi:MAG: hypothetical protein ACFFD8_06575 [Candidatus Thorarchaeota archaeon]